jgi:bifunctional ADP-heptose synthase (sugar kinase/adenylyltransferase)
VSQQQKSSRILLVGDSCYDLYHYGEVKRLSPEAPIPIFDKKYTEKKLGMASNVYLNLVALGASVDISTQFSENKNRYIDLKTRQQVLRVDEKIDAHVLGISLSSINYSDYSCIIISDYNKGYIRSEDIQTIKDLFKGPIFIDTKKKDLASLKDCFIKINQSEYESLTSMPARENLIVTYGGDKVTWNNNTYYPPRVEAYDVCGAGDTFLASLAFNYTQTQDMESAILFAMKAAAATVKHIGVYAPTLDEINQ